VVLRHALEHRLAVDAQRVVRELLALDELLEVDLRVVVDRREHRAQLIRVGDAVRVRRPCAGDRLDAHRIPDLLRRRVRLRVRPDPREPRDPQPGGQHPLLHDRLVAEPDRRARAHAGHPELLAHARRQHHARLPQALDAIRRDAPRRLADPPGRVVLVEQARHLQVVVQVRPHLRRHLPARDIGHPVDLRPDLHEAAGEALHLRGKVGADEKDLHTSVGDIVPDPRSARLHRRTIVAGPGGSGAAATLQSIAVRTDVRFVETRVESIN
jgi:hypothetical protein